MIVSVESRSKTTPMMEHLRELRPINMVPVICDDYADEDRARK